MSIKYHASSGTNPEVPGRLFHNHATLKDRECRLPLVGYIECKDRGLLCAD
jgi:hypothetical protein